MDKQLDDQRLGIWRMFITTHSLLIELIDRELAAADCIPLQWYDVLVELGETPERRLRMHELASRVVLSRSTLTRLVDRLEAEGLLRRERSGSDRRGAYAVLTEQGQAALQRAWPIYERGILAYFGQHIKDAEADDIATALARVLDAARSAI